MTVMLSAALEKSLPRFKHWRVEYSPDQIVWLGLDKQDASANVLSQAVLAEFECIIDILVTNPPSGLIIYSLKTSGFISGADIKEFPSIAKEADVGALLSHGHEILERLASLPCTTVAMINGYVLGGGLELALACDVRVVADEDKRTIGLPEVQLGLHPGLGGTVRAVQLAGISQAMPLMLTGNSVTPRKACKIGWVDKVVDASRLRETAAQLARRPAPRRRRKWLERILHHKAIRPKLARRMRAGVARRASPEHYPAPYAIIDLWEQYGAASPDAYAAEAKSFARLMDTETSRNLVRVYFLQERLKQTAPAAAVRDVTHVHVIGGGVMGGDIAAWCALQGLTVTLQDRELRYIEPALQRAEKLFAKRLSNVNNRAAAAGRLTADVDGAGVPKADLIIEAIFEDRDAKRILFEQIEPRMKPGAVLATNTSSIPLEQLASCLAQPERLIGLHFFNPVAKLPLVEVVRGETSSDQALAIGTAFTRQIGKLPLPCRSHPGFLVNRILAPYMAEALELASEGVPLAEIDQAAVSFGMPMGPIELIDSVGVDVALHVAEILSPVVGRPVATELQELVAAGRLGQKTGHGFYQYQNRKPVKPAVTAVNVDSDVQERLMLAFVNEAAQCVADAVVDDPDLIDGGMIFGTGFAPFRGGPLHYARQRGVDAVVASLTDLAERFGDRFKPSVAWSRLRD